MAASPGPFSSKTAPAVRGAALRELGRGAAPSSSIPIYGQASYPEVPPEFAPPLPQRPAALAGWRPGMGSVQGRTAPPPASSRPITSASVATPSQPASLEAQLAIASFDQLLALANSPAFASLISQEPAVLGQIAERFNLHQPDPTIFRDPMLRWREMVLDYEYQRSPLEYPGLELQNTAWFNQMLRYDPEGLLSRLQSQAYQTGTAELIFGLLIQQNFTPAQLQLLLWLAPRLAEMEPTQPGRKFLEAALSYAGQIGDASAVARLTQLARFNASLDPAIIAAIKAGHNQLAEDLFELEIDHSSSNNESIELIVEKLNRVSVLPDLPAEVEQFVAQVEYFLDKPTLATYKQIMPEEHLIPVVGHHLFRMIDEVYAELSNWVNRKDELMTDPDSEESSADFMENMIRTAMEADNLAAYRFIEQRFHPRNHREDALNAALDGDQIPQYLMRFYRDELMVDGSTGDLLDLISAVRRNDQAEIRRVLDGEYEPDLTDVIDLDIVGLALKSGDPSLVALLYQYLGPITVAGYTSFAGLVSSSLNYLPQINLPVLRYLLESGFIKAEGKLRFRLYRLADVPGLAYLIRNYGLSELEYLYTLRVAMEQQKLGVVKFLLGSREFGASLSTTVSDFAAQFKKIPVYVNLPQGWLPDTTMGEYLFNQALVYSDFGLAQQLVTAYTLGVGRPLRIKYETLEQLMTTRLNHQFYLYLLTQRARGRVTITPTELERANAAAADQGYPEVAGLARQVTLARLAATARPSAQL